MPSTPRAGRPQRRARPGAAALPAPPRAAAGSVAATPGARTPVRRPRRAAARGARRAAFRSCGCGSPRGHSCPRRRRTYRLGMATLRSETANQPPPLGEYDLFSENRPLAEALEREGAAWAAERCAAFGTLLSGEPVEWGRLANEHPPQLRRD